MTKKQISTVLGAVALAAPAALLTLFLLHNPGGIRHAEALQNSADLKIVSQRILADDCVSPPPQRIHVGQDVVICVRKTMHNNGPQGPALTQITKGTEWMGPCTIEPTSWEEQILLAVSVPVVHDEYFTINCPTPSDLWLRITNHIDLKDPEWTDPDLNNNDASTDISLYATYLADLEKVDLQVKPFYCGDSDMDGDEATGLTVAPGTGTCCDNVDNDANGYTDGRDAKCFWLGMFGLGNINEDGGWPYGDWGVDNDLDGFVDEDPPEYLAGQTCPWNGDDDCDGTSSNSWCDDFYGMYGIHVGDPQYCVDEDPKNGLDDDGDTRIDEDPANGFLGIDNDRDGMVDEDGGGRFDFNGNTVIDPCEEYPGYGLLCEEQLEGVDDDGDTEVDEDPLDSPSGDLPSPHEPHYLVKEVLRNNGPQPSVLATSWTTVDAPAWLANAKEDGFTTCTDGLDNDGDGKADGQDPQCLDPHTGEEAAGLHACNDGLDNGDGHTMGDDLIDEADSLDCGTMTEASVECDDPDDVIWDDGPSAWYVKPPSNDPQLLDYPECEQYYDDDPLHPVNKCVPCKIPMGTGPVYGYCSDLVPAFPGYCVAQDAAAAWAGWELGFVEGGVELPAGVDVAREHQFDLACEGGASLHRFSIRNGVSFTEGGIQDPNGANNERTMDMLVACTAYTDGYLTDLSGPSSSWDVEVSSAEMQAVTVNANNSGASAQDFTVTLEAQSPGLGIGGPEGMKDYDGDGWADNIEGALYSDPENAASKPESLHGAGTCSDGLDNDGWFGKDAGDLKCLDTDGDGFSDAEEAWVFGRGLNEHLDAGKIPENMQFPWTCDDNVDNDGDGSCDDDGCTAYPGVAESDSYDTDTWGDCDVHQLGNVRPPVMCGSGWQSQAGATYDVTLAGDGDLSASINIPVSAVAPGVPRAVAAGLVFHCFAPGDYPPQGIFANIKPANPHVIDLDSASEGLSTAFEGNATCANVADLRKQGWSFAPAPSNVLPINEWEEWFTGLPIANDGPNDANQVRVRKTLNVPQSCQAFFEVSYAGETIEIAQSTEYQINATGWQWGPKTLVQPTDVSIGDRVYVKNSLSLPETTSEIFAYLDLPDPILAGSYGVAYEDVGVMCEEPGDHPLFFGSQYTHADWPATCDPTLANISVNGVMEVPARDCSITGDTDGDLFADNVECYLETDPWDNCPDVWGWDDAWPLDLDKNKVITVAGDVLNYRGRISATGGPPPSPNWRQRLDLNKDNFITVAGDVLKFRGKISSTCT
jgi:hypothetical protein